MFCWSQHLPKPTETWGIFIRGLTRTGTRAVEQKFTVRGARASLSLCAQKGFTSCRCTEQVFKIEQGLGHHWMKLNIPPFLLTRKGKLLWILFFSGRMAPKRYSTVWRTIPRRVPIKVNSEERNQTTLFLLLWNASHKPGWKCPWTSYWKYLWHWIIWGAFTENCKKPAKKLF